MNNEFNKVGLYNHNSESYKKIKAAYESGEKIVGIVHATGTGKTYNALQLAYDNKDKKIVYVVPSIGIIEHIKKVINSNSNLDINRDFPNLEFKTYQSFINLSKEEIKNIDCDLLIIDEFHHIGAPVWGARMDTMIETHPNMKIFGMTAYTVRDRGTSYERDMASSDTDELFSNKIVSRYDLVDGMMEGVLPKPIYKSAYVNLLELSNNLEKRVQKFDTSTKEYQEYMKIITSVKKRIQDAPGIFDVMKKNIKKDGKYIYFCPPRSEDGTNDIETIKKQAYEWFRQFVNEENIVFYTSTSEMGLDGKYNRDAFYNDLTLDGQNCDNKLRVMFAINQYNEGIHAPNIDGVIMGRGTSSDIVYFEQLGRALSVRGNTKELFDRYQNLTIEELKEKCQQRDILLQDNLTNEQLIEKLIAPTIIDLTNNFEFIKELQDNLKDKIKIQKKLKSSKNFSRTIISDATFDVFIENQNLYEMLKYVSDKMTLSWEEMYEYAKNYYEKNGNLEVPKRFKTTNGFTYDENGSINLGTWILYQRKTVKPKSERGQLLSQIGMRFEKKNKTWEEMYEYAKKYYEKHDNLEVPNSFRTTDGFTYDENGTIRLGIWITNQRQSVKPESERGQHLSKIGMRFEKKNKTWEEMYEYAKKYYEKNGNLEVLQRFKTTNGFTYDENGMINLGTWILTQRKRVKPESERGQLLSQIGMHFEKKVNIISWKEMYEYAKKYYEKNGNLKVLQRFKTTNGFTYDENGSINLGAWILTQRKMVKPESERGQLLSQIGMRFEKKNKTWEETYEYAKEYYEKNGNLEIPRNFKTTNGFTYDENGSINLGQWIFIQRQKVKPESERGQLLSQIGMRFEKKNKTWEEMYEYSKKYYEKNGNLEVPKRFKTTNSFTYDENGTIRLGNWIKAQRHSVEPESERFVLLTKIGMVWNVKKNKEDINNICLQYNVNQNINQLILKHISKQELIAKINFLNDNNVSLTDGKGNLHKIFAMSSINMQNQYGVSLEQLITDYYINKNK